MSREPQASGYRRRHERRSMAKGMNKVMLMGYVGKDPEIRATQGGTIIATFSLATTERRKSGDEWIDHTEWHSLTAFGRTAEVVREYVGKGSLLTIEGRLETRSWDDKQSGEKKYRTGVIINELWLMPKGDGSNQQGGQTKRTNQYASQDNGYSGANTARQGAYGQQQRGGYEEQYSQDTGISDDDIPF